MTQHLVSEVFCITIFFLHLFAADTHDSRLMSFELISAYELAGRFYMETGDVSSSLEHFRKANEKYHTWGAVAKADRLFSYINNKFASFLDVSCPIQRNDVLQNFDSGSAS